MIVLSGCCRLITMIVDERTALVMRRLQGRLRRADCALVLVLIQDLRVDKVDAFDSVTNLNQLGPVT